MKSDLLQPGPRRWLTNSVFSSVEEEYVSYLRAGRYHPHTVRVYFACVAHFAKWTTEEGLDIALIDEAAQWRFLDTHVPSCDCPYPVRKVHHELRVAIRHLLRVLRAQRRIAAIEQRGWLDGELAAFDRYMRDVGGLADTTRRQRIHIIRRLLLERFGDGEIDPEKLDPAVVRRFVIGEGRCWSSGAVRMVVGSFTSVSLAPPLVAFLPGKASSSWSQMKASGQFCVNVLASDQIELCQAFSRKGDGKFEGVRYSLSDSGLPVLDDVIAYVECSTENEIDAGDHTIVIGLVKTLRSLRDAPALIFYRGGYREVAANNS